MSVYSIRTMGLAAAVALAQAAGEAGAQGRYARPARDTLRFHERTTSEVQLVTPQGNVALHGVHDAVLAIRFLPNDRAEAWYDSLSLSLETPMGAQQPATESLLHQPYALAFDARGRTRLVSAPAAPEDVKRVSDLTREFDDFFLRLPATPLRDGLSWSDTLDLTDSSATGSSHRRVVVRYRVRGDTTVRGERALVITALQQIALDADQRSAGAPPSRTTLAGSDDGIYVFAPSSGHFLGRQHTGTLKGETTVQSPMGPIPVQQSLTYQSLVESRE